LSGKPEGRRQIERPRLTWEYNIEETRLDGVDRFPFAQEKYRGGLF
jgi:hypothetical protein